MIMINRKSTGQFYILIDNNVIWPTVSYMKVDK